MSARPGSALATVEIVNGPNGLPDYSEPPRRHPGDDVVLYLHHDLRHRGFTRAAHLAALCLAATRQTRRVYVTGGNRHTRRDVAKVLRSAGRLVVWQDTDGWAAPSFCHVPVNLSATAIPRQPVGQ